MPNRFLNDNGATFWSFCQSLFLTHPVTRQEALRHRCACAMAMFTGNLKWLSIPVLAFLQRIFQTKHRTAKEKPNFVHFSIMFEYSQSISVMHIMSFIFFPWTGWWSRLFTYFIHRNKVCVCVCVRVLGVSFLWGWAVTSRWWSHTIYTVFLSQSYD